MRKARLPAILLALVLLLPAVASAATPYTTYTMNGYGEIQETQTAYLAVRMITKFGTESFNMPDDLFVAKDGTIYVADTKNRRVLVGNADGDLLGIVGKGILQTPRGVFVTDNGHIYVADRDEIINGRLRKYYRLEEGGTGTVGIIGPKRMDYRKVVSTLRKLTDDLDEIFNKKEE